NAIGQQTRRCYRKSSKIIPRIRDDYRIPREFPTHEVKPPRNQRSRPKDDHVRVHVLRAAPIGLPHHELFRRSAVQRSDIETGSGWARSEEKMAAVSKKLWTAVCSLIGFQLRDGNRIAAGYLDSKQQTAIRWRKQDRALGVPCSSITGGRIGDELRRRCDTIDVHTKKVVERKKTHRAAVRGAERLPPSLTSPKGVRVACAPRPPP